MFWIVLLILPISLSFFFLGSLIPSFLKFLSSQFLLFRFLWHWLFLCFLLNHSFVFSPRPLIFSFSSSSFHTFPTFAAPLILPSFLPSLMLLSFFLLSLYFSLLSSLSTSASSSYLNWYTDRLLDEKFGWLLYSSFFVV